MNKLRIHPLILSILLGTALSCFLLLTNPTEIGPAGLGVFFILSYFLTLSLLELFYRVVSKKPRAFWLKAVYALAPVSLLALGSLRQLSLTDITVVIVLVLLASIYHDKTQT